MTLRLAEQPADAARRPHGRRVLRVSALASALVIVCTVAGFVLVSGSPPGTLVVAAGAVLFAATGTMLLTGARLDVAAFALAAATAPWNDVRITAGMTLADAALLACAVLAAVRPAQRRPPPQPVVLAAGGMSLVLLGTFVASIATNTAAVGPALKYAAASVGVLGIVALLDPRRRQVELWLLSFAVGAGISVAVGLLGWDAAVVGRDVGLTSHPNHLGLTSCLGVFAAIGAARLSERTAWRLVVVALVALNVVGVMTSGSRAALVGLLVGAAVLAVSAARHKPLVVAWALTGSAVLVALLIPVMSESNALARLLRQGAGLESAEAADQLRVAAIERGLAGIAASPLIGRGFPELLAAHNIFVQAVAAGGILGLAGIVTVTITSLRRAWRLHRATTVTAWALCAALVGYLACGAFQNILFDRYVWVVVALALAYRPPDEDGDARPD